MREIARRSSIRAKSPRVLSRDRSRIFWIFLGSSAPIPSRMRSRYPSIAASGARSSWATMDTKVDLALSNSFNSVISRRTVTVPMICPFSSFTGAQFAISVGS